MKIYNEVFSLKKLILLVKLKRIAFNKRLIANIWDLIGGYEKSGERNSDIMKWKDSLVR